MEDIGLLYVNVRSRELNSLSLYGTVKEEMRADAIKRMNNEMRGKEESASA